MNWGLKLLIISVVVNGWAQNRSAEDYPIEISIQAGHFAQVRVLEYSRDGRYVLSGGLDRTIRLWESSTGREIRMFQLKSGVQSISFSPDMRLFASVDMDGRAQIWETHAGNEVRSITHKRGYKAVRFLPDGKGLVLGGGSGAAEVWTIQSAGPEGVFEGRLSCHQNCHRSMDVSPDGKLLLTAAASGEVIAWNISNLSELARFKKFPENRHGSSSPLLVSIDRHGKRFATLSEDEGMVVWTVDGKSVSLLQPQMISSGLKFTVKDMQFDPLGNDRVVGLFYHAVSGKFQRNDSTSIHVYGVSRGNPAMDKNIGPLGELHCLALNPVEPQLLVAYDNIPRFFDLDNLQSAKDLSGYLSPLQGLVDYWIMRTTKEHVMSPDGRYVAKKVGKKAVTWDLQTGQTVREFGGHDGLVLAMAFSPDGKLLVTGGQDQLINCWEFETGKLLWTRESPHRVFTLTFDPQGKVLISGHFEGLIMSWQAETGNFVRRIRNPSRQWLSTPMELQFTPNGFYFSWTSEITEIRTGETVKEFIGHTDRIHCTGFSPDGKLMLTGGWDGEIMIWDIFSSLRIQQFSGHSGRVYASCFSPDGLLVASGGEDHMVRVWEVSTGLQHMALEGHKTPVTSVSFNPDQTLLISSSQDGVTKIWDLRSKRELLSHIALDRTNWMAKTPSGQFFATEEAMKSVHFVQGTQTFSLDQFFEDFYQPHLVESVWSPKASTPEDRDIHRHLSKSPPPELQILSPKSGGAPSESQEILVKINDTGGGISEVKITQNGKRISGGDGDRIDMKGKKSRFLTYQIKLIPGVNRIAVTGFSTNRIESAPATIELHRPITEPNSKAYILAVGINEYKNPQLNLNYALADAQGFASLLSQKGRKLFKEIEVVNLFDQEATKAKILEKLADIANRATKEDVFYFYYAGHGSMIGDRFYFIPSDNVRLYDQDDLEAEALYAGKVQEILQQIPALKQVIIVDACHSGGSTELLARRGGGEEKALAQLSRSAGVHVLASSGSDQYAGEFATLGHGIFTYVLLEGLSGKADGAPKDGKVTVYELKSFLDDQVPEITKEIKGHFQYPNTFSRGSDFPVALE